MFLIIYEGWGLLVVAFGLVAAGIGIAAEVNLKTSSAVTPYLVLSIWAVLCLVFGRLVNNSKNDRVLLDPTTHEEVVLKNRHSLFFIQIQYWAVPILLLAAGFFYTDVQSGKIDLKPLTAWAKPTSPSTPTSSDFKDGYEAYKQKKYTEALADFTRAADRGEVLAQFFMGLMFANGFGVEKDYTKALGWFRKAAEQGETGSEAFIGYFYEYGLGVPQDLQKALEWYRKAADGENSAGQYYLGMLYLNGKGVEKNLAEATKWLGKSAALGDEEAKKQLAAIQPPAAAATPASSAPDPSSRFIAGKINIIFKDAVPSAFENGRAMKCALVVGIYNDTKYHLNRLSFKIGDWSFSVDDEMNANTHIDDYSIGYISLSSRSVCSDQAAYVQRSVKTAGVFDCEMPNVAEGDCQALIAISSAFDDAAIERVRQTENTLGATQTAPLREAILRAGLDKPVVGAISNERLARFAGLLDTFVAIDSQGWAFNKYNPGSMNTVIVVGQTPNRSTLKLKGFYTFRQGERVIQGWVIAVIEDGALKCLQYHDMGDECRAIRLPPVAATR